MKKIIFVVLLGSLIMQSCSVRVVERNRGNVVVVKKAPRKHRVVVIKKKRYYTWGGNYYRKTARGFVLVKI
ncbi:MAG: hypothetical protein HRT70_00690 [Flavobacteriaceae bacterium]|nr:hypothetical protein [Flavobacteriaceae bacterium]